MEDLFSLANIAEAAMPLKRGRGRPRKQEERMASMIVDPSSEQIIREHLIRLLPMMVNDNNHTSMRRYNNHMNDSDSELEEEDAFDEGNSDENMALVSMINSDSQLDSSSSPSSPLASPPSSHGSPNHYSYKMYDQSESSTSSSKRGRGRPRKENRDSDDYDEDVRKPSKPKAPKKKRTDNKMTNDWSDASDSDESASNFTRSSSSSSTNSWFNEQQQKGEQSDYTGESPVSTRKKTNPNVSKASPNTSSVSVRRVPCFFASCTHSYRRPNSNIVEFSDRPLILSDKYAGYTIRSCKKHHDWWRNAKERGTCEICRGLNDSNDQLSTHSNRTNTSFHICSTCAYRQSEVLGIPVDKSMIPPNMILTQS